MHAQQLHDAGVIALLEQGQARLAVWQGRLILGIRPEHLELVEAGASGSIAGNVVVTEPTVPGEHDLERVLKLALFFEIPTSVCVNKWEINREMTERIERKAEASGARVIGRIRYDRMVTTAQIQARAVVEIDAPSAADIRRVWQNLKLETGNLKEEKENT